MIELIVVISKIKQKIKIVSNNFMIFYMGRIIRTFLQPKIPVNPNGKVLIHIGCGELNDSRYINVDNRMMQHIHFGHSIEDLYGIFPKEYADLIYICHVLEHISHKKLIITIASLYKFLKKNGILRISVPDFNTIVDMYRESNSVDSILLPLMGGQDYKSNFHFSIFNRDYLTKLLLETGFKEIREWDPENVSYHSFDDWSKRKITLLGKDYKISLNIEAIK